MVGPVRKIVLAALPALVLCLPGMLPAQSRAVDTRIYTYRIPEAARATGVTVVFNGAAAAGWDVSVAVDPIRCEIYCTYKQRRSAMEPAALARLLPPPLAIVQVSRGWPELPVTFTVDPSGLGQPAATAEAALLPGSDFLPRRRLFIAASLRTLAHADAVPPISPLLIPANSPQAPPAAVTPLRV